MSTRCPRPNHPVYTAVFALIFTTATASAARPPAGVADERRTSSAAQEPIPKWRTEAGRIQAWRELAAWYIDNGLAAEALKMVDALHEAGEYGHELDVIQARAMLAQGVPSEAVNLLQNAVKQAPQADGAWDALGIAYFDLARLEESAAAFERALRIEPARTATRNNLAFVMLAQGRCADAVPHLERVLGEQGGVLRYRNNLAFALVCDGQPQRALDLFRSVLPEADARYNMGVAYERLDKLPSAVLQYQQAIEIDPEHEAAADALARLTDDIVTPVVPTGGPP